MRQYDLPRNDSTEGKTRNMSSEIKNMSAMNSLFYRIYNVHYLLRCDGGFSVMNNCMDGISFN